MEQRALVVLSGGQDSTTCLFLAKSRFAEVHAITFDYNQRHKRELMASTDVARMAGVASHKIVTLGPVLMGASPLVSANSLEQYADMHSLPGGIEKTFVPMRNQLFLTIAANYACHLRASYIYTGVSEEDYGGYPDCRAPFVNKLAEATNLSLDGTGHVIQFVCPLISLTKAETVSLARKLPGCWEALAHTHTSYDGAYPPTGHDHATLLRAKGFLEANEPDPLVLRACREGLMDLPATANYDATRVAWGI